MLTEVLMYSILQLVIYRVSFGVYHPIYLQALQCFVAFSNQFRHDAFGVEAAKTAVNIASKIYGFNLQKLTYSNVQLASALQGSLNAHILQYSL